MDDWSFNAEDLEVISQGTRLYAEWSCLVGLRDTMGIALKGARNKNASYKQALLLGEQLIPQLFNSEHSLLNGRKLSETARKYLQIAEASSEPGKKIVSATELMKEQLSKLEKLTRNQSPLSEIDLILKEIKDLRSALGELQESRSTENQLIFRDAYRAKRDFPVSEDGRNYREFRISDERILRIRVLHPDKPEHATGTDLIYENYWEQGNIKLVRLAALQYKMWSTKSSLYIDERIEKQLGKLKEVFCDKNRCVEDSNHKHIYRLPYCAAFLRPTNKLQSENATLLSSGYYVPVCVVRNAQQATPKGTGVLYSKEIRSSVVTHKIFEEMFNSNMIGSRWLTYKQLEDLYHTSQILEPDESIIIHAQEVPLR